MRWRQEYRATLEIAQSRALLRPGGRRIVGAVAERMHCDLCGRQIQAGESWMAEPVESDGAGQGGRRMAHAGCVYREEHDPELRARWQPQERTAS
jgi:hypothetical protein